MLQIILSRLLIENNKRKFALICAICGKKVLADLTDSADFLQCFKSFYLAYLSKITKENLC